MQIWIVNAFTDQPYNGNPAAVAPVEEFPDSMSDLKIAIETRNKQGPIPHLPDLVPCGEMQVSIEGDKVHITGQAITTLKGEWMVYGY